ncbi:alpha/beta hydrolase-fold protein [Brevibacterium sp. CFH 10365]|uniref:alpha/beta hydrolase-fold protein n=1 Tax=Brevibacterium sp. CFH 10365 TaxID=2585207 RepID=UPI0012663CAA|nr:alpha/beta hydrolase-fold protein [Brevibacterium sp. CFH 10365]
MHTIAHSPGSSTMSVTFTVDEPDPRTEVILDIDFLLHASWPDLDHLVLRPAGEVISPRSLTVELPSDVEITYRFLRRPFLDPTVSVPAPTLDHLRALCTSGRPDPDALEHIHNPFGSEVTSSVLRGPDATDGHPVWNQGEPSSSAVTVGRLRTPRGRLVTIVHVSAKPIDELVIVLDGDVWMDSLELPFALARWDRPTTAFALVSTPDRENLVDRRFMSALLTEEVLPIVDDHLSAGARTAVTIVGHSYGGLAAAGLACDHPDRFGSAIIGSGSFWYRDSHDARDDVEPGDLTVGLRTAPSTVLAGSRFLLHVGREEGGMIDQSQMFADAVAAAGAEAELRLYSGGHDYAWYRHALFDALDALNR